MFTLSLKDMDSGVMKMKQPFGYLSLATGLVVDFPGSAAAAALQSASLSTSDPAGHLVADVSR